MINFCGCMGPMHGEPECPCAMDRLGLPRNVAASTYACLEANMKMDRLFGSGGFYETQSIPVNARVLVSRNKREGGYLGNYRCVHDPLVRRRHHRKGASFWSTLRTLRHRSRP